MPAAGYAGRRPPPIPLEGDSRRALKHNAEIMRSRLGEEAPPGTHTADCPGLRVPDAGPA